MRLVIADTGPVNYLIQIDCIDLLPRIFERVVLPAAVQAELSNPLAPLAVQLWIADSPAWLEIAQTPAVALSTGIHKGGSGGNRSRRRHARRPAVNGRPQGHARSQTAWASRHRYPRPARSCRRARPGDFAGPTRKVEGTSFRRPDALLQAMLDKHIRPDRS